MIPRLSLAFPAFCLLFAAVGSASLRAATVTFGPSTTLQGDSDVLTTGTLVRAAHLGGPDLTVNGVAFAAANSGGGAYVVDLGLATLTASADSVVILNDSPTFAAAGEPFGSLPQPYRDLLGSAAYNNSTSGTLTLTLSDLTPGTTYTVQFFVNDSRDFHGGGRTETVTSGGATSAPLFFSSTGSAGGVGQFVVGTFTADARSQDFLFAPLRAGVDDAQLNAYQLRATNPRADQPAKMPNARSTGPASPRGK